MLARRKIGAGAAIATGVILAAVLTGSASAGTPTPGCHGDENAGAKGVTCVDKVTGALGVLPVHAKIVIGTPSCPDATTALVQAKVIVAGLNGKGGTSAKLAEAQEASNAAHKVVHDAEVADNAEDAKDAAVATATTNQATAQSNYNTAAAADTDVATVPPDSADLAKADAQTKLTNANNALTTAQAADTEVGSKEDPGDTEDAAVAVAKSNAFDADQRLHKAQIAEGTAEQGIVDAEVVIGQACKTPVVIPPAPPTADSPAPQPSVIDGQAPAPQIVTSNLPVTG